jgi:uncharacterized protein YbjT (DUF2867 family)
MKTKHLYAVTGITGKIGGVLARTLLAANQPVRAVVRNADKGAVWAAEGCEIEGWIDFEGAPIKGSTEIETVLRKLVEQQRDANALRDSQF